MKKFVAVLVLVATLMIVGATTASAHPGHTSCKGFGQHNAAEARARTLAGEIRSLISFFGPGVIGEAVALVHNGGQFGEITVPALCQTR